MEASNPTDLQVVSTVLLYATICVVAIVVGATIVGGIAFFRGRDGTARTFSLLVQRADATRMITVMAIVIAACLLTMLGKLNSEGAASILSGVAGYILGGANAARGASRPNKQAKPPPAAA